MSNGWVGALKGVSGWRIVGIGIEVCDWRFGGYVGLCLGVCGGL
jgi:hypothetical protein